MRDIIAGITIPLHSYAPARPMTSPRRSHDPSRAAEASAPEPTSVQGESAPALSVEQGYAPADREEVEFARLVVEIQPNIHARALPRLRSAGLEHRVDDLVQEVLFTLSTCNVIRRCDGDPVRILNYSLKVTDSKCRDAVYSEGARNGVLRRCVHYASRWLGASITPDQELVAREIESLIVRAEERMSPRRREVFDRVYRQGMSYAQAAETLGMSPNTVDAHYTKASTLVRETLVGAGYRAGPDNRSKRKERNS